MAILLPTAGENLEVVFKALVGSLSQRLWDSGLPGNQTLRVVVLDEKRRLEVYRVAAGVNRIGELLAGRRVQQILMVHYDGIRFCLFWYSYVSVSPYPQYFSYNGCSLALGWSEKDTMVGVGLDCPSDSRVPTYGDTSLPCFWGYTGVFCVVSCIVEQGARDIGRLCVGRGVWGDAGGLASCCFVLEYFLASPVVCVVCLLQKAVVVT